MNVTIEELEKKYGKEEATRRFDEISDLGGYGSSHGAYIGGLDVLGALAESNTAIPEKDKARIAELSGVSRKDVEKRIEDGRRAVARGDSSKDHIIPPDGFAPGKIDGKSVADATK